MKILPALLHALTALIGVAIGAAPVLAFDRPDAVNDNWDQKVRTAFLISISGRASAWKSRDQPLLVGAYLSAMVGASAARESLIILLLRLP